MSPRTEAQQRHAFHPQGGHHHLPHLAVEHRKIVFADDFHDNQLRMHMAAAAIGALGEGGPHLRGRIGGKQFHIPFLLDAASQQVQVKVLVPQALPNADNPLYRTVLVVYPVFLGILDQAQDEGGHAHQGVRLQAPDGVPLKFRNAVSHPDDAGAQLTDAQEIGQAGHEALVHGGHELDNVSGLDTGAFKALLLVVGQALQVLFRAAESNRVSQGTGSGDT